MLIKQTTEMTEAERIAAENSNNQYLQALSYAAVGMIYPYAGTEAPDTFMICDGTALNVTEYPELFSVIGYTFGGSDDIFNLPDLRGKTLVGMQADDSDFGTIGKSGGEKTHKMTAEENGKHTHSVIKAFGNNALDNSNQPDWAVKLLESAISNTSANPSTGAVAGIGYSGEGKAHNNLQPYTVINYIIKVVQGIPNLEVVLPIDQTYNAESENAQSGVAVSQAVGFKKLFSTKITQDLFDEAGGEIKLISLGDAKSTFNNINQIRIILYVPKSDTINTEDNLLMIRTTPYATSTFTDNTLLLRAGSAENTSVKLEKGYAQNFCATIEFLDNKLAQGTCVKNRYGSFSYGAATYGWTNTPVNMSDKRYIHIKSSADTFKFPVGTKVDIYGR